jgi:hypothetical protein
MAQAGHIQTEQIQTLDNTAANCSAGIPAQDTQTLNMPAVHTPVRDILVTDIPALQTPIVLAKVQSSMSEAVMYL